MAVQELRAAEETQVVAVCLVRQVERVNMVTKERLEDPAGLVLMEYLVDLDAKGFLAYLYEHSLFLHC